MTIVGSGSNLDPEYQAELEAQYELQEIERERRKSSGVSPFGVAEDDIEFAHQRAYFQWCAVACIFGTGIANDPRSYSENGFAANCGCLASERESKLKWVYAITLNQASGGHGNKAREAGAKAGMSDTGLDCPSIGFGGFRMEFKRASQKNRVRGGLSPKQVEWKNHYVESGLYYCVAFSWREGVYEVCKYLNIKG